MNRTSRFTGRPATRVSDDESSFEPESDEPAADALSSDETGSASESAESSQNSPLKRQEKRQKAYVKSKRLANHTHPKYIDLLNEDIIAAAVPFLNLPAASLTESEFGGSHWSPAEKNVLFEAISHYGRDDLPKLADAVGSKSILEIRLYLIALKEGLMEENLNARRPDLPSWVDVPAAVEVSQPVEERLDLAAEALNVKLWKQESRREREHWGPLWLIDYQIATDLDALFDSEERRGRKRSRGDEDDVSESPTKRAKNGSQQVDSTLRDDRDLQQAAELFNSRTWVSLQHNIFMNAGGRRSAENWRSIATEEEEPSIIRTAYTDFYQLTRRITERLVHASHFQLMTRQRAVNGTRGKTPQEVEAVDVVTALDILNMPHDGRTLWTHTARRCGVQVVSDVDDTTPLGYDNAEALLLDRKPIDCHQQEEDVASDSPSASEDQQDDDEQEIERYADALDDLASHKEEYQLLRVLGDSVEDLEDQGMPDRPHVKRKSEADMVDWRDWTDYRAVWE